MTETVIQVSDLLFLLIECKSLIFTYLQNLFAF